MRKSRATCIHPKKGSLPAGREPLHLLLVFLLPLLFPPSSAFGQAGGKTKLLEKVQRAARAKAKVLGERIKENPKNRDLHLERVRVLMHAELFEDALEALDGSLRVFKKDFDLLRWTSRAFLQKAKKLIASPKSRDGAMVDFEDAMLFADQALELKPKDFECRRMRGFAAYYLGEDEDALSTADRLIEDFGQKADGYLLRAETLFRRYTDGVRNGELNPRDRKALAEKIRKDLEAAVSKAPLLALSHRRLADLSAWEGDMKRAFAHYLQALTLDPLKGAPLAWLRKARKAGFRLTFFQKAQAGFAKRHPRDPRNAVLFFEAGYAAFELGNNKLVQELMKKAWTLDPGLDRAAYYFAISSLALDQPKEASIALSHLLRESPHPLVEALKAAGNQGLLHANSLAALAKKADQQGALVLSRELNHALGIYRNLPEEWNNYAFLCRETGKYEEAWRAYKKALDLSPKDPQILNDAALILQYHLHRDLDKARKMYHQAIDYGKAVLASRTASPEQKRRARGSIRDALGNLAKMNRKGSPKGPGRAGKKGKKHKKGRKE